MAPAHFQFCLECGSALLQGSPVALPPPPPRRLDLEAVPGRLAPNERVGDWQLRDVIAHGGFAEVYLAEHLTTGRRVAIKALAQSLVQSPYAVERFIAEARLLERVRHPNIVQLLALAHADRPFLVLELIEGPSLAAWMQRGARADRAMLWALADQLARALAAVHAAGVMCRDLQPANIMLVDERATSFKLIDLGAASEPMDDDPEREPVLRGAPLYMAPEVLRSGPRPASDLYALGLVLYELASGQQPFQGRDLGDIIVRILQVEPPKLSRRDLPRAFRKLIMRLLDKDPANRPTALELVAALSPLRPP